MSEAAAFYPLPDELLVLIFRRISSTDLLQ